MALNIKSHFPGPDGDDESPLYLDLSGLQLQNKNLVNQTNLTFPRMQTATYF